MFDLPDDYVWDFWLADDAPTHHLFFLHAPRGSGDPDLRHDHARVGHAVGSDLRRWERQPDPLPVVRPGFDDLAQWTGCTVHDGEAWWLFTTGRSRVDHGRVQRIGAARSPDLVSWERTEVLVVADPRWYDVPEAGAVHWRDPWIVRDDAGTWHLYCTARTGGPGSGVVGHATSTDLVTWQVRPPLSSPTGRFDWLEVLQVVEVEGRWVVLFNCLAHEMPQASPGSGGIWTTPTAGPGRSVDVGGAVRLTDETSYVGKLVEAGDQWQLMAFRNQDAGGDFVGGIADPVPVRWRADGRGLELLR